MKRLLTCALLVLSAPAWGAQNLLDTYDQALHNATALASAQAAVGAAQARYRQARGQLLPQLSLSAEYRHVQRDRDGAGRIGVGRLDLDGSGGDRYSATLNVSQALFNWSAWQNMDAAAARAKRAHVLLSAAEQDLVVRTVQAYFNVLAARDALVATRERVAAIRRQLDRAQAAFKAGLAPITDKQEARSSLDAAQVDAIAAQNQLAIARETLRALTGQAPRQLAGIAVHEPATLAAGSERERQDWLRLAMDNAPVLTAARAQLKATKQQLAAAQGRRYPEVALVGSVGHSERELRAGVETWSVGIQLQMPLFAGGSISAAVAEARYAVTQAHLDWVAARRQLRLDVSSAWRSARAAADRVAALDQAIASARTALKAAKAGYRLGNRTILDVIEASTELAQRKAERQQAWYDYALARLRLRRAAGVLGYAALARVNARLAPPEHEAGVRPTAS